MSWLDRWRRRLGDAKKSTPGRSDASDTSEESAESEALDPELARLVDRARSLPRSIEPQRDLWSGIENRITGRGPEPAPWSLALLFPRPLAAAAVGLMLVATTAMTVIWISQPGAPRSDAEMTAIAGEVRARDGVADVHESILALLESHRAELPPETVAVLDQNLRSIDRAIAEIHLALESNPDHQALGFLLAEAYRSEADLLERLEWWLQTPPEASS
jgi:hypothetical protein